MGKDNILTWNLVYTVDDFASKNGQVWEINIPKFLKVDVIEDLNITVKVPPEFGPLLYVSPTPVKDLTFTKDLVVDRGISAAFGSNQIFNFVLKYHLSNPKPLKVTQSVALPPDTNYQRVIYKSIKPTPTNVIVDSDGNYMAEYELNPGENIDILASGSAKLFFEPIKGSIDPLSPEQKETYLKEQTYWEIGNSLIKSKAQELKTPSNIYKFLVSDFSYNENRLSEKDSGGGLKRLGALTALENPKNLVCMEFTDLFIALARSVDIPARELNGFAYSNNPKLRPVSLRRDILHSWAEYWDDKRGWVAIDPMWGNTNSGVDYFNKLDLNHFVFVIHGKSSEQPVPAGSYGLNENDQKNVFMDFGTEEDMKGFSNQNIDVSVSLPKETVNIFPVKGKLFIENKGGVALSNVDVSLNSDLLSLKSESSFKVFLAPFGKIEKDIQFGSGDFQVTGVNHVNLAVANNNFAYSIVVKSPLSSSIFYVFGGILGSAILLFFAIKSRRLFIQRQKV